MESLSADTPTSEAEDLTVSVSPRSMMSESNSHSSSMGSINSPARIRQQFHFNSATIGTTPSKDHYIVNFADIYSWKLKKDEDGSVFVAYLIHVTVKSGLRWIIERRYQQFRNLRKEMKRLYPELKLHFPSKHWFFNLSESTIKRRQKGLRIYLSELLKLDPQPQELSVFLQVVSNVSVLLETPRNDMRRSSSMGSLSASLSVHDFKLVKVLGKGSFGKVFLVRPMSSGTSDVYAMKVLKKAEVVKRHQVEHTKAERWILENIKHPFVLSLRYAFQTSKKLYMIFDYCAGGELFFHLKKMKRFTEGMVRFYGSQLALALNHLHSHAVIYRDLKPENVLLDRHGNCKLTDFGLSKIITADVDPHNNTFCGTPEYLSPEMLVHRQRGSGYGKEIDWWALGIVLFELLTGWPPFFDRDFSRMCEKILTRPLRFPSKYRVSNDAQQVIKNLLIRDPWKRLCCGRYHDSPNNGIQSLQMMTFFQDMNFDLLERGQLIPPFVPNIGKDSDDTRNFDKEFTRMALKESPTDNKMIPDDLFENFSFSELNTFQGTFNHNNNNNNNNNNISYNDINNNSNNNNNNNDPSMESINRLVANTNHININNNNNNNNNNNTIISNNNNNNTRIGDSYKMSSSMIHDTIEALHGFHGFHGDDNIIDTLHVVNSQLGIRNSV